MPEKMSLVSVCSSTLTKHLAFLSHFIRETALWMVACLLFASLPRGKYTVILTYEFVEVFIYEYTNYKLRILKQDKANTSFALNIFCHSPRFASTKNNLR